MLLGLLGSLVNAAHRLMERLLHDHKTVLQTSYDILSLRVGDAIVVVAVNNLFSEHQQLAEGLDGLPGYQIADSQDEYQTDEQQTASPIEQLVVALQYFMFRTYQGKVPLRACDGIIYDKVTLLLTAFVILYKPEVGVGRRQLCLADRSGQLLEGKGGSDDSFDGASVRTKGLGISEDGVARSSDAHGTT